MNVTFSAERIFDKKVITGYYIKINSNHFIFPLNGDITVIGRHDKMECFGVIEQDGADYITEIKIDTLKYTDDK